MKNGTIANITAPAVRAIRRGVTATRDASVASFVKERVRSRIPILGAIHARKAQMRRRVHIAHLAGMASVYANEVRWRGRIDSRLADDLSCLASHLLSSLDNPVIVDCSDDFTDEDVHALFGFVRFLEAVFEGEVEDRSGAAVQPHVKVLRRYLRRSWNRDDSNSSQ